ncbi:MAG: sigma-70 family RNA polymerase sigma factor [Pseudomonadota bacterium]|nr:sigma-70 family RNA polymerase sigma factor [Pseudomonadota bacterium]
MTDPSSDEALMDRVQQGSADAYATLFARYRAPLYGYLLRMTRRPEVADEVFQESFLSVHRARTTWSSGDGTFRSWLYRIATNAVRDGNRRSVRRPEVLGEDHEQSAWEAPSDRIALERALADLPENLRDAFLLGTVHGFDHNEIAAALEITPDNARARVSRARARLRELLEET